MPPYGYLGIAGGAFLLLMLLVQLLNNRSNLNHIKSKTVGDGQHGTARFASPGEVKQTYRAIPFTPRLWRRGEQLPDSQGIIVGRARKAKIPSRLSTKATCTRS